MYRQVYRFALRGMLLPATEATVLPQAYGFILLLACVYPELGIPGHQTQLLAA